MKTIFCTISIILLTQLSIYAQGVGINDDSSNPDASAMLDVKSTTKGMLVPRMTSAERVAISLPATGLLIYQTNNSTGFWYFDGAVWKAIENIYTAGTGIDISNNVISTTCGLSIGQSYQGGIIFHLDASGCHGLICATSDQSAGANWGSYVTTGATYDGLKAGLSNTSLIVDINTSSANAANLCNDYVVYSNEGLYNDWYLPSKQELNLMYINRLIIGGFGTGYYWCSTELDNLTVWHQRFSDGFQNYAAKILIYNVRAIRAF
jgi:hypothetical protein